MRRFPGNVGDRQNRQSVGVVRGLSRLPNRKAPPCVNPEPTKEELESAIADERCWWCEATHGTAGKPIVAWSAHWSKAHGILVSRIREILEVGMRRSFISDDMRAAFAAKIKRDPRFESGRYAPKKKAVLPGWVVRRATERIIALNESLTSSERRASAARASRARQTKRSSP